MGYPLCLLRITLILALLHNTGGAAEPIELTLNTQIFSPFSYYKDNEPAGPAVELVERLCEATNASCNIKILPWTRAQREVKEHQVDGMFLIGWNLPRTEFVYYSEPLIATRYGFFTNRANPVTIGQPENLQGYTVTVYGPSNTQHSLELYIDKMRRRNLTVPEVFVHHNMERGFYLVDMNKVHAVYSNVEVGNAIIQQNGFKELRLAGIDRALNYYVGFSKQRVSPDYVRLFNQALRNMRSSGELEEFLARYGMQPGSLEMSKATQFED